jgi:hypothetical protein
MVLAALFCPSSDRPAHAAIGRFADQIKADKQEGLVMLGLLGVGLALFEGK